MAKLLRKFVAKPVVVQAGIITEVHAHDANHMKVVLENGEEKLINLGMTARMQPKIGDYYVIQEDGYVYLNPKDVFERKYGPEEVDPTNVVEHPVISQETQITDVPAKEPEAPKPVVTPTKKTAK